MKTILSFSIMCLLAGITMLTGQTHHEPLWPDGVPGSKDVPGYEAIVDSSDNWVKMMRVAHPVMDYYPAPGDGRRHAAVVVCPGGAYGLLAIGHEGVEIARWLNGLGVTVFVLKYRLPNDAIMSDKSIGPLQDVQRAIRLVRQHAIEWNIDAAHVGVMGFSAGGHLAASASTRYDEVVYEATEGVSARPDFSLLIYPVISMDAAITHAGSRENLLGANPTEQQVRLFSNEVQVNATTPPAFLVHSMNDGAVSVQNSVRYAMALQQHDVACELHLYETGGHGYGLGRSTNTESTWPMACEKWMKAHGIF
ncbi:acetyl esterase/lipase [Breznakibacter xylanolyticus]|uniref:Acetyl esterase/lipase n=1 Tax=Breznakibacter xylanolyticus TaxID=990 RepID=A0A2W7NLL4_9BACT|nr:alpha/beta hydrolase [Breznakibacter xylanolyticus]PZX20413.1 acetyl esterase/lipase [Breznakibacter xylanolyticus]